MKQEGKFSFRDVRCPVCEGEESRFLGYRGGEAHQNKAGVKTSIVRCLSCSHQFPNPMPFPAVSLSELYINADEYFCGHDMAKKRSAGLDLMDQFEKRLGKRGRVLDFGCGTGELLSAAAEKGWEATGIDTSEEFVGIARKEYRVDARAVALEDAGFEDASFDAIVMGGLIEHLYSPYETLTEVKRLLKPGGILFFDAPNEDGLYMSLGNLYMKMRGKNWVIVMAPTFAPFHVQGFNARSIAVLLERVGLDILNIHVKGTVWKQKGKVTARKRMEYAAAWTANSVGNLLGRGSYMSIWAQRSPSS